MGERLDPRQLLSMLSFVEAVVVGGLVSMNHICSSQSNDVHLSPWAFFLALREILPRSVLGRKKTENELFGLYIANLQPSYNFKLLETDSRYARTTS